MTTSTAASTTAPKTVRERSDPFAPYMGLVLNAFKHNVTTLLGSGSYASRSALHNAYNSNVGNISYPLFTEWLDKVGIKLERSVTFAVAADTNARTPPHKKGTP